MSQPSPWILLIGGGAMLNVSLMVGGAKAPAWVRYPGMAACVAVGLLSIGLALARYFQKKPERPKYKPKRSKDVELPEDVAARVRGTTGKEGGPPPA
jgi:hypothetical protein